MELRLRKKAARVKDEKQSKLRDVPVVHPDRIAAARKRLADQKDDVEADSPQVDFGKLQERVRKVVDLSTFEQVTKYVLDTGYPDLQRVLGSEKAGIPYGKMIELSGIEHGGKTLIGLILMAIAQQDGATAGHVDAEISSDEQWERRLGVIYEQKILIEPKLIKPKQQKDATGKAIGRKSKLKADDPLRIEGAEEMFAEMKANMAALYEQGVKKQFWLIDSLANLTTIKQIEAGSTGQTMNTNADLPAFLAREMPALSGLAANYNALIVVINQLRVKLGVLFGDPFDTPGGRAIRHAFGNRTRTKRLKNGMLRQGSRVTGIVGVLSNQKNKMGHGSVQSEQCGFRVSWRKEKIEYDFMSVQAATELLNGE